MNTETGGFWARFDKQVEAAPEMERMKALGYVATALGGGMIGWQKPLNSLTEMLITYYEGEIGGDPMESSWQIGLVFQDEAGNAVHDDDINDHFQFDLTLEQAIEAAQKIQTLYGVA